VSWAVPRGDAVPPRAQAATPPDDPGRGLVYKGLRRPVPGAGPCRLFELTLASGERACTHGPDPAPGSVDPRYPAAVPAVSGEEAALAAAAIPCQGDGASGPRVQLLYARAAPVSDRYPSLAANFQTWAARIDDVINQSAAETGGVRHVRFVHMRPANRWSPVCS
jgi:hypothetical protein